MAKNARVFQPPSLADLYRKHESLRVWRVKSLKRHHEKSRRLRQRRNFKRYRIRIIARLPGGTLWSIDADALREGLEKGYVYFTIDVHRSPPPPPRLSAGNRSSGGNLLCSAGRNSSPERRWLLLAGDAQGLPKLSGPELLRRTPCSALQNHGRKWNRSDQRRHRGAPPWFQGPTSGPTADASGNSALLLGRRSQGQGKERADQSSSPASGHRSGPSSLDRRGSQEVPQKGAAGPRQHPT